MDRNKPPETWITAAPFDTITLDKGLQPQPGTIPIRFHVYWAGSDQDGAVVGYYWAVVETLPRPQAGSVRPPPLPGPRAGDYRYTARTDSIFIFNVAEDVPDRQHAFFIYAVDDQGKPDPTPARFIFNALDRFPPLPVFDVARATGTVHFLDNGVLRSETRTFDIRDTLNFSTDPSDTVPSGSRLTFRFHGEATAAGSIIKGFRYKLDESELQPRDPDSLFHGSVIEYHVPQSEADPARRGTDTIPVASGTKVFTLRAVDQSDGSRDATRRFQLNFSPDTWFAGPDPNVPALPFSDPSTVLTPGVWYVKPNQEKVAVLDQEGKLPAAGLAGTLLSPDSVNILPAERVPRRTFLEVWQDTVYLRREDDTVHMASWVIIHNGGFDQDSPYNVKVADGVGDILGTCDVPNPPPGCFPGGRVLTKAGPNGSPVGFRSIIPVVMTVRGLVARTAQSALYPLFDPNDVLNFPRIAAYHPMFLSGRAYALQRAEDGDGARDGRVGEPDIVVERPRDDERSLRPLVLTFNVNQAPELQTSNPLFRPRTAVVDTFSSRTWDLRLPADDVDPYVSGERFGGPSNAKTLRIRLTVTGRDTAGNVLTFSDPDRSAVQQKYVNVSDINMLVPPDLATGPATLTVELCDCSFCENNDGEGRCITRDIQVYYVRPPIVPTASTSRPGLN